MTPKSTASLPTATPMQSDLLYGARFCQGGIALTVAGDLSAAAPVHALVNGIRIGTWAPLHNMAPKLGTEIVISCDHFPALSLPVEIRFVCEGEDRDIAAFLPLIRPEQVLHLIGPGRLENVQLQLEGGLLRGYATNPVNGFIRPQLICRVNGTLLRSVNVDQVLPRPGRGALVSFSVGVDATDLSEAGTSYEILSLPDLGQVAALRLAPPALSDGVEARLIRLEAELKQMSRRLSLETGAAHQALQERHGEILRLVDGFAEYMLSLVYDRLNTGGTPDRPAPGPESAALASFRAMIADNSPPTLRPQPGAHLRLNPADLANREGWHHQEEGYVWMSDTGTIYNPHPAVPVKLVSIAVQGQLDADVLPLHAFFDGAPARIERIDSPSGKLMRLNIYPEGEAVTLHMVQLLAHRALRPIDLKLSNDLRVLSIAVSAVDLHYQS